MTSAILVQEGLDKNLLHCRPLNIRLLNVIGHASVTLNNFLTSRQWNGRMVACLPSGIFVSGSLVALPCAIIETVASTTLCLLGVLANELTQGKFSSFRKFSFKCFAYSTECLTQIACTICELVFSRKFPTYHIEVTLLDHIPHLFIAAVAHTLRLFSKVYMKPETEREQYIKDLTPSIITLVSEGLQGALDETMRSLSLDFGERNLFGDFHLSQRSQEILVREIRNLNLERLTDVSYRNRIAQNLQPVFQEILILFGARQVGGITIIGPQGNEAKYQDHLMACTKEAIKRVYADEKLATYIGGREAIEGFYAETTIPLAKMSQLAEIEKFCDPNSVKCPEKFNDNLAKYNTRHTSIKDLSEKLRSLTPDEKDQLVLRLLKGSDAVESELKLQHQAEFNALVSGIGELGGDIHQGNLMGVLQLHVSADLLQAHNMFAKAWQDAVVELKTTTGATGF